jgi:hypothetical protein
MYFLLPKLVDKLKDYIIQVNFILSLPIISKKIRFYPDFGRFNAHRLQPLIKKIKLMETSEMI